MTARIFQSAKPIRHATMAGFMKEKVLNERLSQRIHAQGRDDNSATANFDEGKSNTLLPRQTKKYNALVAIFSVTLLVAHQLSRDDVGSLSVKDPLIDDLDDQTKTGYQSEIAELQHCDMFTNSPATIDDLKNSTKELLQKALHATYGSLSDQVAANPYNRSFDDYYADMKDEYSLQLLELQLMEDRKCNFSQYRPTVTGHESQGQRLQQVSQATGSTILRPFRFMGTTSKSKEVTPKLYRLAIVISAFKDFDHLKSLLRAVHLPQHYIVIHVDRFCDSEYKAQIENLLTSEPSYCNVVLVQFGTVIYTSDTISMINLKILRWLTFDLKLDYEQVILLNGSVYPLLSAQEMVESLEYLSTKQNRSVWLGQLHFSRFDSFDYSSEGRPHPDVKNMAATRLFFTRNNNYKLITDNIYWKNLPQHVTNLFIYKTTSGNQGTYSRHVVELLLTSDTVMELFALTKSATCCVEERNWAAALDSIGYGREANYYTSMFQVWGGTTKCKGSMLNAVLSQDQSLCYVSADPFHYKDGTKQFSFRGGETVGMLISAKERGSLFARKFRSDDEGSVQLMKEIEAKVWKQPSGSSLIID